MKSRDGATLLLLGLLLWGIGTVCYGFAGTAVFETTGLRYWLNFILVPAVTTVAVVVRIPGSV